jgi:predicted molibdopterin-dependent oxidoreductase YjgC
MFRLKIDNIECEVEEGTTLLETARISGVVIPTLCHKDGLPHYSSCMVCMVKDNRTGEFIPSCSALAKPDSDIDASGPDVISLRKKAVELLLSEHRAECEAPCRIVCPAGLNVPLMNRLLADGKIAEAINLSSGESYGDESPCINCPAYCENACRRKKVDLPVSIRNLQLFISGKLTREKSGFSSDAGLQSNVSTDGKYKKITGKEKRFTSMIGKLEHEELAEWLKECTVNTPRFREISSNESASGESNSCMHCDCRASGDCRLRDIAEDFKLKDPRGKLVNAPAFKKINIHTNLIFENAKCIKCGLCVRICSDNNDDPPLCFINRGFVSIISEPLTFGFNETMKTTAEKCIKVCPTGALAYFK